MQYLLDTHAFLWFINGDSQLSDNARKIIENPSIERYLEATSGQPNFAAVLGLLKALAGDLEHENIIKGPYVPTP